MPSTERAFRRVVGPRLLGAVLLVVAVPLARAAPLVDVSPAFRAWHPDEGALRLEVRSREDVRRLRWTVRDAEGRARLRRERFDIRAGVLRLEWDGRFADGGRPAPGRYTLVVQVRFADGRAETEEVELRILEAPPRPPGPVRLAPPALPYRAPAHRLDGAVSRSHRDDRRRAQVVNETRVRLSLATRADGLRTESVLDHLRRGDERNLDNSAARAEWRWGGAAARVVFRRPLDDFDDPLRLFADFRTANDKRGISVSQTLSRFRVRALAVAGRGGPAGLHRSLAARASAAITPDLRLGVGGTLDLRRDTVGTPRNRTAGVDLRWRVSPAHVLHLQSAHARTTGGRSAGAGPGHRAVLRYRPRPGVDLRVGYLALGSGFASPLADPGNQVVGNARGPEIGLDLFRAGGGVLGDVRVAASAFVYDGRGGGPDREQVEGSASALLLGRAAVAVRARSRREAGRRFTSLLAESRHRTASGSAVSLRLDRSLSPGVTTDRVELGHHRGTPGRHRTLVLELVRRAGRLVAGGTVREAGLRARGRHGAITYEAVARRTGGGPERGLNLFARAAVERRWLHRYRGSVYLALGDRSAVRAAGRVEIGVEMRF